ncbi:MAG TPA: hypothetical protein VGC39_00735, partial [Candidatus Methylacidiphilales bacterium]
MGNLPPLKTREVYLASMKDLGDRYYDADRQLLTFPVSPNVHIEYLAPGIRHCTRESLYYAVVLLLLGGDENLQRAGHIVDRIIDAQEQSDPQHALYGLWHYYAEESVLTWPLPDTNWAAFNGLTLLLIWHEAGAQFSDDLQTKIRQAIRRAATCVQRSNTDPHYTNIALKGAFVVMAAGELLDDATLIDYGMEKMRLIAATFRGADSFAEYNSPTYAAVSLTSLGAIQTVVRDEAFRILALEIQHSFWRHVGRHFHVATGELAGPHSRAYHLTMRESPAKMGSMIERATHGLVKYAGTEDLHDAFGPVFSCCLDFDVTPQIESLFLDPGRTEEVREIARRFSNGGVTETTTYLCPSFCVGSVNFQDGWEQRHNLIAYWPEAAHVGYLRHRYLHDSRPCSGGYFTSAQNHGRVLAASFLSDFADDHPCFQTEGVIASYMGPVLDIGFHSSFCLIQKGGQKIALGDEVSFHEDEILFLQLPHLWIACKLLRNRSGLHEPVGGASIRVSKSTLRIEYPHYRGETRAMKWTDFSHAETAYGLVMEEAGNNWEAWTGKWTNEMAETTESPNALRIKWAGLQVSLPIRVETQARVREFYRSGHPWDSITPRKLMADLAPPQT